MTDEATRQRRKRYREYIKRKKDEDELKKIYGRVPKGYLSSSPFEREPSDDTDEFEQARKRFKMNPSSKRRLKGAYKKGKKITHRFTKIFSLPQREEEELPDEMARDIAKGWQEIEDFLKKTAQLNPLSDFVYKATERGFKLARHANKRAGQSPRYMEKKLDEATDRVTQNIEKLGNRAKVWLSRNWTSIKRGAGRSKFLRRIERNIHKAARTTLKTKAGKYISREVRKGSRELAKEHLGETVGEWIKSIHKLGLLHAVNHAVAREISLATKRAAYKAGQKAADWMYERNYQWLEEQFGIRVNRKVFEEMAETTIDLFRGEGLVSIARKYNQKVLMSLMRKAGIDVDKYFVQDFLYDPSAARLEGMTGRYILEAAGYETEKDYLVNQFLAKPSLRNIFRKALKRFTKQQYGKAKEAFEKLSEGIEEVAESSEAAEAEALAESAIELAPLLLA